MSIPELSVVLPFFNEKDGVRAAVETYRRVLTPTLADGFELILVDDASTDGTGAIADELASGDVRLRVLHHERNRGQVAGILSGFAAARGRIVTHNGVDLPFHPEDTAAVLHYFRAGADVVVVERKDRRSYPLLRKVLSWGNVLLLRLLLRSPFRDHNFVQFFRRDVLATTPVQSCGVNTVTAELVLRLRRRGCHVVRTEAPYHVRRHGKSSIDVFKVILALRETIRLWRLLSAERSDLSVRLRPFRANSEIIGMPHE